MATFTATALAMCRDGQDFTVRQMAMIGVLAKTKRPDERTVRALSETMGVLKPVVTRSADVLEKAKLAKRAPDPADKRSIFIEITDAGRAYAARLNNGWTA